MKWKAWEDQPIFLYLLVVGDFCIVEKWFDKKKSPMMEHEALAYNLLIEGDDFFVQP